MKHGNHHDQSDHQQLSHLRPGEAAYAGPSARTDGRVRVRLWSLNLQERRPRLPFDDQRVSCILTLAGLGACWGWELFRLSIRLYAWMRWRIWIPFW